jgi:TetR/AcrR family transcriptional regulator, tetracycline repressor protein
VSPTKTATRPALSREVVADRALELADAEGLEAVTIRRLATELGVTPMALYWHFRTKEDLLAGLGDRVLDSVEVPERTWEWDADLRAGMVALVTAMRAHPQVAQQVAERVLTHPNGLALVETALSTIAEAGFSPEPAAYLAMQAMRTVMALVTGDPVDDSGMTSEARDEHQRQKLAALKALSPKQYPALIAHADAMTYCKDVELFFDLGIDHYIAGLKGMADRPS